MLHFFDKIPIENPILKSVILSLIALVIFTILVEVPGKFLTATNDVWRYFLIATTFNAIRILTLGIVVGYLYDKLDGDVR